MANYIDRVYGPKGLHTLSLHPGGIDKGLQLHVGEMMDGFRNDPEVVKVTKNPEQGAATSVYGAVGKEWEGKGGFYLEDGDVAPVLGEGEGGDMSGRGAAGCAFNVEGRTGFVRIRLTWWGCKRFDCTGSSL